MLEVAFGWGQHSDTPSPALPKLFCPLSQGLCSYQAPLGSPQPPNPPTRTGAEVGKLPPPCPAQ